MASPHSVNYPDSAQDQANNSAVASKLQRRPPYARATRRYSKAETRPGEYMPSIEAPCPAKTGLERDSKCKEDNPFYCRSLANPAVPPQAGRGRRSPCSISRMEPYSTGRAGTFSPKHHCITELNILSIVPCSSSPCLPISQSPRHLRVTRSKGA